MAAIRTLLFALLAIHATAGEPSSAFNAALELYHSRRYSDARALFARCVVDPSESIDRDFYLGRLALWFDDRDAALRYLERGAAQAPQDARFQNALGDAYGMMAQTAELWAKLGWAQKSLHAYQHAVQLQPQSVAYRWSLLGYYLVAPGIAGGSRNKAVDQAGEIKQRDATEGRIAFATIDLSDKNVRAAFALFDEVLRDSPDDFLALYQIGRCAALSGEQLDRGRVALQHCLRLPAPTGDTMPTLACVHYRLANILEQQGNIVSAQAEYAAATAAHPDFRPTKIKLRY
jgi:tetratricopeptide (TPR) repeat protein